MNCRNCGTELPTGALFCGECGTTVAVPRLVEPHTRPRPGDTAIIQPIDIRAPRLEFLEPDPADLASVRRDSPAEPDIEPPLEPAVDAAVETQSARMAEPVSEPIAEPADDAPQIETSSARPVTGRAPAGQAGPSARARPRVPDPWPVTDHSSVPVVEASFPTTIAPAPAAAGTSASAPTTAAVPAPVPEPAPAPAPTAPRRLTPPAAAPVSPPLAPPAVRTPLTPPASVAPPVVVPPVAEPISRRPSNAAFESQHDDVEATRIVRGRQGDRFVLQFSTGENATVFGTGLVGRNPVLQPGEFVDQLVTILDQGKSVSKTHLEFGQTSGVFWVVDRFSANGTVVRQPDAPPQRLDPGKRQPVARGTRVDIGEQFFVVS
ncbi:hypothetical protein ABIE21_000337 [Conyzicola nivalis]|uniref:FHA domain-containing protein n=1 Tax=Conyzicola nivalis TaxID=1477021 RepID=A0ABV2QIH5_9MICO